MYPTDPFRICDDTNEQQRIDVLQDIAVEGSKTQEIQRLAHTVRHESGRNASDDRIASEALFAIQCLEYHSHPDGEWFQTVDHTLKYGGNCEDLSTALVALLLALGIPARVAWIDQYDMPLNHVVVRLENGLWADPSVWGARLGEDSYTAIDRVQIEGVTRPADLAFRASKEYPMFKRNLKMKPAVRRPAGDALGLMDASRLGGIRVTPVPVLAGPVLAILAPAAESASSTPPPAISGTAPANTLVKVVRADTGEGVGTVSSQADGSWTLNLPIYPPGTYILSASTPDGASLQVRFTVLPASASASATQLAITFPTAGAAMPTSPSSVMGTAPPGTPVIVTHGSDYIGTPVADSTGKWSVALPAYAAGSHSITAKSPTGTVTVQFTIGAAPTTPAPSPSPVPAAPSSNAGWWLLGGAAVIGLLWWNSKKE